jgi:hypothetical protein
MAYPLTFTLFPWQDSPSTSTPYDKESAQSLEKRLSEFTEKYEVHWRKPVNKSVNLYKAPNVEKGDVAFAEEQKELYYYTGAEWKTMAAFIPFWKSVVKKETELPTAGNTIGDIRLTTETPKEQFFICYKTSGGAVAEQWKEYTPTPRHAHSTETLTWSVAGELAEGAIPGGFRRLATEETATLYEIEFELTKGEAELELKVGGTAVTFTGATKKIKVKEAAEALAVETPLALTSKAKIELIVSTVTSTPEGLALSAFAAHISQVS